MMRAGRGEWVGERAGGDTGVCVSEEGVELRRLIEWPSSQLRAPLWRRKGGGEMEDGARGGGKRRRKERGGEKRGEGRESTEE